MSHSILQPHDPDEERLAELLGGDPATDDDLAARLAAGARRRIERTRARRRAVTFGAIAAAALLASVFWLFPGTRDVPPNVADTPSPPVVPVPTDDGRSETIVAETTPSPKVESPKKPSDTERLVDNREPSPRERLVQLLDATGRENRKELRRLLAKLGSARLLLDIAATSHGARRLEEALVFVCRNLTAPVAGEAARELAKVSAHAASRELWRACSRFGDDDTLQRVFLQVALRGTPAVFCESLGADLRRSAARLDPDLATNVARAIGSDRPEDGWTVLLPLLGNPGSTVAAIEAAGRLGDARALPYLERYVLLADARGAAAVTAIGRIPGNRAVRLLVSVYRRLSPGTGSHNDSGALRSAVTAIRSRPDETLAELRRAAARNLDATTIDALAKLFPRLASAELSRWLETASRRERPHICRALARLGDQVSFDTLVAALDKPALARVARQSLAQIARRDLGPRPESWRRWWQKTWRFDQTLNDRAHSLPPARPGETHALALTSVPRGRKEET